MPQKYPLAELRERVGLVLIGGTICTGKDTAAKCAAAYILEKKGKKAGPVSLSKCLMDYCGLNENTPRERVSEVCSSQPEIPWVAEVVETEVNAERGSIVVISGLRRPIDAEYFFDKFPYSHFVALFADNQTLVDRIVRRNRDIDFPPGTLDEDKPGIALKLLREEERMFGINAMLKYVCQVPCKTTRKLADCHVPRGYIIDTSRQEDTTEIEQEVKKAMWNFGIK